GSIGVLMDALAYRTSLDRSAPYTELRQALQGSYPRHWCEPRRPRHIDPPSENELDFIVHIPREPNKVFAKGHCIRSAQREVEGGARVSILVFPNGTSVQRGSLSLVPIFVEVVPKDYSPDNLENPAQCWEFRRHYFLSIWAWDSEQNRALRDLKESVDELREEKNQDVNPGEMMRHSGAVRWVDKHTFQQALPDRGWYEFPLQRVRACCDPNGFLWLRARVWSSAGGGKW
ncbi:unnamed protein product, partial [Polarella glacialis]